MTNPQVDAFIEESPHWRPEMETLRTIVLDCGLTEEFKWRAPCYTVGKGNVAAIGPLKDCCSLSFFKGALLKDPRGLLQKPGRNTRAARLFRFTSVPEIVELEPVLKSYLQEAVEIEEAGLKVDFARDRDLDIPPELQEAFDDHPALQTAFEALTPGRQRGYILHFTGSKNPATRRTRIERYTEKILDGKGFHDCTCGHSRKLPRCDGSHKFVS